MKVTKLGLRARKGTIYSVTDRGAVQMTRDGETTTVQRLKLADIKNFMYFIDEDGDLAREYRHLGTERAWPRAHPTKPASATLKSRALVDRIRALVFPPDSDSLASSGFVDGDDLETSRAAYEQELERLASEISYALGDGKPVADAHGSPGYVWKIRDRAVILLLTWEDKEFPALIELRPFDPKTMRVRPRTSERRRAR